MNRCKAVLLSLLIFGVSSPARADFIFGVVQDVSALSTYTNDLYVGFHLNSGDNGLYNNTAEVFNFGLSTNVSLIGSPVVLQGNSTGSPGGLYLPHMILSEGTTSLPMDQTWVIQKISIDDPSAIIHFEVQVTENYAGLFSPDTFTYQLLYDDDGDGNEDGIFGSLPIPVTTDLAPGSVDFVQYAFLPGSDYTDVLSGGPLASNPAPFDAVGVANVIPEPATCLIWGVTLAMVGTFHRRRRTRQHPLNIPS